MKIKRLFTKEGRSPYEAFRFEKRESQIINPDGTHVGKTMSVTVPDTWSAIASDVLAQKYFRKTGVPQTAETGEPLLNEAGEPVLGAETDARQVFERLAGTWTSWGVRHRYFESETDAQAYHDEMTYLLAAQIAAPNSPQWFNTGLFHCYGIKGKPQGHYFCDPETGQLRPSECAYERPQAHACFIQSVEDDLVNKHGIMDLWTREARIFKYGSGSGTNFSRLRGAGEPLSGGGRSSGLMSFLKIGDRAAGAIKSGGTTRRAAKMVILDVDHPEIEEFVTWKSREEEKVAALVAGSRMMKQKLQALLTAAQSPDGTLNCNPAENTELRRALQAARRAAIPEGYIQRVLGLARQGITGIDFTQYDIDWNNDAYQTVSGQNSNNTVRVTNAFREAMQNKTPWSLRNRCDDQIAKQISAADLWDQIAMAAWECADPGVQYDDTINEWHTCPAGGRINASNPCSEYMFLDNTACNLASLNLCKFLREDGTFDTETFRHAVRLLTITLEISVVMASYPSLEMAQHSYDYRALGLGYANLGSMLMRMGLPYDSDKGRQIAAAITALMTGEAYETSARLAQELGPFARFAENRDAMLRVIRNHRRATYGAYDEEYEGLTVKPRALDSELCPDYLLVAARAAWDRALAKGEKHGFRNAQASVLAPTGTIGLVMDCDTTGIEPDYALVKFKKLAGGGYFKIINQAIPRALLRLGYPPEQVEEIVAHAVGHRNLERSPHINRETLAAKGFSETEFGRLERRLISAFSLEDVLTHITLGREFLIEKLGLDKRKIDLPDFDLLRALGFTHEQIAEADRHVLGTMTVEGAPHLREEHLAVFDCANRCGRFGTRFIHADGHLKMMAAVQPFISGAISKTINMPVEATVEQVRRAYEFGWDNMLKAVAIYRDGSKLSQAMHSGAETQEDQPEEQSKPVTPTADIAAQALAQRVLHHLGQRHRLPPRCSGYRQKATIGGHSIYLHTGEYEDGKLGEVFLDMHKEGAAFRSLMNSFAIAISLGLQYGVPLDEYVDAFIFTRFEPNGIVEGHPYIKMSTSIIDYIFRDLAVNYLGRYDLAHVTDNLPQDDPSDPRPERINRRRNRDHGEKEEAKKGNGNGEDQDNGDTVVQAQFTQEADILTAGHLQASPAPAPLLALPAPNGLMKKVERAKAKGYTGDICPSCGSMTMVRNGTCLKCETCGETTGCS